MTPPRIVFACESLRAGNGGIAHVDRMIARILDEKAGVLAPEVHVFSDARPPVAEVTGSVRCYYYGGSRRRFALGLWRAMLRPGWFIYDAAYYAKIHGTLRLGRRRPCLIFLHGIEVWEHSRRGSLAACRRADLLVANSHYTRDRAEKLHGGFARARVCWLGTESSVADAESAARPSGQPVVLVVGRMQLREDYKGHRELIAAWPEVLARHPGARLEIVGQGGLVPQLRQLAGECGVAHRVDFLGFVPEEQLAARYRAATIFALPSRGEGFGLVYVEAMRHGLPVLASEHDAGGEVVQASRTGLLANLDRPGDLAARLGQLLDEPAAARRMGLAGQERWQREFTFDAFRERFSAVLEEFLNIGGKPDAMR
ncbi:MAG: glycosyltransferase family 4 protein [Opitutaceae bacterium]